MKNCKICNSEFQPKTSESCCSFDCKKRNRLEMNREWKAANPDAIKKSNFKYNNKPERKSRLKEYRKLEDNLIRERESGNRYRIRNPDVARNGHLLRNYNITLEDYNVMLSNQDKKCAICKKEEVGIDPKKGKKKELAVDHCHRTGKVRGLLCFSCNSTLGKFDDSIELLENAIEYLKRNQNE